MEIHNSSETKPAKIHKSSFNLRSLRLSLKFRPEILKLVLKMRHRIRKKTRLLNKMKQRMKNQKNITTVSSTTQTENDNIKDSVLTSHDSDNNQVNSIKLQHAFTQTDKTENDTSVESQPIKPITDNNESKTKDNENSNSESSNVASEKNSGWNLKSEENEKSIAEQVKEAAQSAMQQSGMVFVESAGMYYDYKTGYYYSAELGLYYHPDTGCYYHYSEDKQKFEFHSYPDQSKTVTNPLYEAHEKRKARKLKKARKREETDIDNLTKNLSQVSLRGQIALDSIAKHHPPCMRVIVRETNLQKLKMGSLFLVTKDGGTVGREGSAHTILLEDNNVSRNHLDIRYDMSRRTYTVTDLGSKNGTTLNGVRISESQIVSEPVDVLHGSTLQIGETKLLCHIHPGIDTCGHCEPGLVMETQEKEKKAAYTRTCSVQKQHQLELARLKNKYAPQPLAIEETAYNDRAKERRDKVGSSHHSEKTQSSDLDTCIAPDNKGFKLLQKMGWSKGEGLGKDRQGDVEPIPLVSNEGKSGLGTGAAGAPSTVPKFLPKNTLGTSTMRLAAKTKLLQPPAKAFQDPLDDDSE